MPRIYGQPAKPKTSDLAGMHLAAARARGICDPRTDANGEFWIVREFDLSCAKNERMGVTTAHTNGVATLEVRTSAEIDAEKGDVLVERVWRNGENWYVTNADGEETLVGRRPHGITAAAQREGIYAHA